MRGKEPIDVFLTENKNTDADTRGCHTHAVSQTLTPEGVTRIVSSTGVVSPEERGVSPPVDGGVR